MPNWRESSDYDFTENLDGAGWAWQFLRRNEQYRKDYEKCLSIIEDQEKKCGPYSPSFFLNKNTGHLWFYDPPKIEGETDAHWVARATQENIDPRKYSPKIWYGKKWHLKGEIQDPKKDLAPSFTLHMSRQAEFINFDNVGKYVEDGGQADGYIAIGFDLSAPIGTQWDSVKERLTSLHEAYKNTQAALAQDNDETPPKSSTLSYSNYLRVLDAKADKIKNIDIARILIPKIENTPEYSNASQRIYDWHQAAKKLSKQNYHKLILQK